MNPFGQLLWREWRRNRIILVAAVAFIAVGLILLLGARTTALEKTGGQTGFSDWLAVDAYLAVWLTIIVSAFLLPLIAANTVAGEHADRSAEFLAPLPVSRDVRLVAKVALLAAVAIALWGPMLTLGLHLLRSQLIHEDIGHEDLRSAMEMVGMVATFTLLATALAWLIAAWIESPVIAGMTAIAVPIVIPWACFVLSEIVGVPPFCDPRAFIGLWFTSGGMPQPLTFLVAALLFGVGSAIYLRRLA